MQHCFPFGRCVGVRVRVRARARVRGGEWRCVEVQEPVGVRDGGDLTTTVSTDNATDDNTSDGKQRRLSAAHVVRVLLTLCSRFVSVIHVCPRSVCLKYDDVISTTRMSA